MTIFKNPTDKLQIEFPDTKGFGKLNSVNVSYQTSESKTEWKHIHITYEGYVSHKNIEEMLLASTKGETITKFVY